MEYLSDAVPLGPATLPAWIVVVAATMIVTRLGVPVLLRRAGLGRVWQPAFDVLITALLTAFIVWKLYPLVEIPFEVVSDPMVLLRAPGGRGGVIAGAAAATLYAAWRIHRDTDRRALAVAAAITAASAALLFAGGTTILGAVRAGADATRTIEDAPDFELLDGSVVEFSDLAGQPAVLTFWATWCAPCTAELPYKKRLHREFGESANFIGVNMTRSERSIATVSRYVADNQIGYPVALDRTGAIASRFLVRGTPTTVVLDAEGSIVARWTGPVNADRIIPFLK